MKSHIFVAIVSFGLGAAGTYWLLRSNPAEPKENSAPTTLIEIRRLGASEVTNSAPPASGAAADSFRWSSLESSDFQEYIRRLRAIDCPERTIADIIRAEVDEIYAPKLAALNRPMNRYWSSSAELESQKQQRAALEEEKKHLLYDVLRIQRPINPTLVVEGLAPEKQAYVQRAADLFPRIPVRADSSTEETEIASKNRAERIKYLSQFLTPEELQNYRLEFDGSAAGIYNALQAFSFSEKEFRDVFEILDGKKLEFRNGRLAPELEQAIEAKLGPERYRAYSETRTPENLSTMQFAQANRLPIEKARELIELRKTLAVNDPPAYANTVETIIGKPQLAQIYLKNPIIHRPFPEQRPTGVPPTQVLINGRPQ
jgi:hypothetical protein